MTPGQTLSLAVGQRSLGPGQPVFPLLPVQAMGCPHTSDDAVQYPLEIAFDLARVDRALFDQASLPGLDRWAPLLPPLATGLSMGEGGTPLLPMPDGVATAHGVPVLIKDESRNPTQSHKDRLNLCTVSAARAAGAAGVAVASSGNHGIAAAAYAARAGLRCLVITPPGIGAATLAMLRAYGALVVAVPVVARWPLLRMVVSRMGFHPVSNLTATHTGHPWGPEGYKTIAYELFLQMGRRVPGCVVVPTGYGELLYGLHKGFRELKELGLADRLPRLFPVEPAARGPLHRALADGRPAAEVPPAPTRQVSIACTVGGYRGVLAVRESGGRSLLVEDAAVLAAQDALRRAGLWYELSACAAAAALPQVAPGEAGESIVVVATASGLKDPIEPAGLEPIAPTWEALRTHLHDAYGVQL